MTFTEFHAALVRIANGHYCTSKVEVVTTREGKTEVEFACYIDGLGWGETSHDPHQAVASLCAPVVHTPEALGDLPELSPTTDFPSEF